MEPRSTFVTVLAWIFIIGTGFAASVSIMQVLMVSTMFNGEEFPSIPEDAPAFAKFMSQYFHLFVYGFCALTLFTFVSSVALLKRKNWARLAFIVILTFGVFWQIGGIVMQFFMFSEFPPLPDSEGFEDFERISNIIRWFSFAMAVGISALFVWLIKRLLTQPTVSEFTLNKPNNAGGDKTAAGS